MHLPFPNSYNASVCSRSGSEAADLPIAVLYSGCRRYVSLVGLNVSVGSTLTVLADFIFSCLACRKKATLIVDNCERLDPSMH